MKVAVSGDTTQAGNGIESVAAAAAKASDPLEPALPTGEYTSAEEALLPIEMKSYEVAAPVKVNMEVLDKLINLVSEMVLARNRLLPFVAEFGSHNFSTAVRTVDLLTQELQERMMKTRMQPISQIWAKFPRPLPKL